MLLRLGAVLEVLLVDREDLAGGDRDVRDDAGAALGVDELHVVMAGADALQRQPLVVVDAAVVVELAQILAVFVLAGR